MASDRRNTVEQVTCSPLLPSGNYTLGEKKHQIARPQVEIPAQLSCPGGRSALQSVC